MPFATHDSACRESSAAKEAALLAGLSLLLLCAQLFDPVLNGPLLERARANLPGGMSGLVPLERQLHRDRLPSGQRMRDVAPLDWLLKAIRLGANTWGRRDRTLAINRLRVFGFGLLPPE